MTKKKNNLLFSLLNFTFKLSNFFSFFPSLPKKKKNRFKDREACESIVVSVIVREIDHQISEGAADKPLASR